MSYFTGTQAANIEGTVLDTLKSFLGTKFALAPYSATFAKWDGPGVSHNPDDDFFSKKPWVFLEVDNHDFTFWGKKVEGVFREGARHTFEISADLLTSDACRPAERPLKDALMAIVRAGYHDLWALKLEEVEIKAGQGSNPKPNRINPHMITFVVHTLN